MAQQNKRIMKLISEIKPQDELYKQQTPMTSAVEWLFEQISNLDFKNIICDKKIEIFEQAKQMEKEQIIEAYIHGINLVPCDVNSTDELDAEKYYNEIYRNNTPKTHT